MGHCGVVVLLGLVMAAPGCVVPRPQPEQLAGYQRGFSTPQGAFESLRTAFQAEVLEWEFRCFSQGFIARNELTQQAYRAFRPELLAQVPHLRWGLARAQVEEVRQTSPTRATLRARIPVPLAADPRLEVQLVREEYAELSEGPWVVADAESLGGRLRVDDSTPGAYGLGSVWVQLDLAREGTSEASLAEGFSRLRGAREWKVDGIGVAEE